MNAPAPATAIDIPTIPGTPFAGGYYAGRFLLDGREYANILAPKAVGEHADTPWNKRLNEVAGALSYIDGLANTRAMAAAGSAVAQWALAQRINGHDDWHIPALDQLELCYRLLKPHADDNSAWARAGINLHSVPQGHPYTRTHPTQTANPVFQLDGDEAFDEAWFWTSTQDAGNSGCAWLQSFGNGSQYDVHESGSCRVRLVRRELIR